MKQIIDPAGGPGAVGPYSPAIKSNGLVFVSGQIPLDPATGELVGGDIQVQVRRVLENIGLLLKEAGSGGAGRVEGVGIPGRSEPFRSHESGVCRVLW